MATFAARYRGDCANCPHPIEPGDECGWVRVPGERDAITHAQCPAGAFEPAGASAVCPKCFLVHAPQQRDCW